MVKETSLLDMADAQILGFIAHRRGNSLADLVGAMGLTSREWEGLKDEYPTAAYLDEADIREIETALRNQEQT